jgi:hypothetical protein
MFKVFSNRIFFFFFLKILKKYVCTYYSYIEHINAFGIKWVSIRLKCYKVNIITLIIFVYKLCLLLWWSINIKQTIESFFYIIHLKSKNNRYYVIFFSFSAILILPIAVSIVIEFILIIKRYLFVFSLQRLFREKKIRLLIYYRVYGVIRTKSCAYGNTIYIHGNCIDIKMLIELWKRTTLQTYFQIRSELPSPVAISKTEITSLICILCVCNERIHKTHLDFGDWFIRAKTKL